MASLYPALVVMALLMPVLPVLVLVEIYFLSASLYLSFGLLNLYREFRSLRFAIYSILIIAVVLQSELAIWILSPSESSEFSIMISKVIFYLILGTSLVSLASNRGDKLRTFGLILVIGSFSALVPTPIATLLSLILLLYGCLGASRYLSKGSSATSHT